MRIYSMTATFGKLEHETLTLKPGLNVIQAPNEWGKSTWCAFLLAMLYGLDTRAKSTKGSLADKERYAPWSGSPMEGRLEVEWQGRPITIERRTRGRVPLGEFRAYETDSGIPNLWLRDQRTAPGELWELAGEDTLEGVYFRLLREQAEAGDDAAALAARISRELLMGKEVALP